MFAIPVTPNWACMAASFSMACQIPYEDFIRLLGHDGSAQRWPDSDHAVGFHIQECIDVAIRMGLSCTPIEMEPLHRFSPSSSTIVPIHFANSYKSNEYRFYRYLKCYSHSVVEVYSERESGEIKGHAVACDGQYIFDPRGKIFPIDDLKQRNYKPLRLWIIGGVW